MERFDFNKQRVISRLVHNAMLWGVRSVELQPIDVALVHMLLATIFTRTSSHIGRIAQYQFN